MRTVWLGSALVLVLVLSGCGYNRFQSQDEQVKSAWSEVLNQYQRRYDLIPNLVNAVKGYAAQEQRVFIGVAQARSAAGTIQATPALLDNPQAFAKFEAAQSQLTGALSRLLAVSESYPQLKSDQNFLDLQAQLEGTENRIAVARMRYIQAVQSYNVLVRSFPTNLTAKMFGYSIKPNFSVQNETQLATPPTVSFAPAPSESGAAPAPAAAPAAGTPAPAPAPAGAPAQ